MNIHCSTICKRPKVEVYWNGKVTLDKILTSVFCSSVKAGIIIAHYYYYLLGWL